MIRQLPPGSHRPPVLDDGAAMRSAGVRWAVRSGRYRPPLDAVVEALLPWIIDVRPSMRVVPGDGMA